MKSTIAALLYASFLLLALRVQAAEGEPARDTVDKTALLQRAAAALEQHRASGRSDYLDEAEAAVSAALNKAPDDFLAQRSEVEVLLARHADSTALARSRELNRRFPDDLDTYALLIDAELALGLYREAESDTQRLLDLRPDHLPGLVRAARLRELYGDWQGAIDVLNASLNRVTEDERELRARLYTQLARLHVGAGNQDIADQALAAALGALPDYPPALREGVRIARQRGASAQALRMAEHLYRVLPAEHELLLLARAAAAAGQGVRAAPMLRDFVTRAHAIAARDDNANLALSSYYAFEGHDIPRAVSFAVSARAQRADVDTLFTYATALHRAGRDLEAKKVIASLKQLGYRDLDFLALADTVHPGVASAADSSNHLR